MKGFCKIEQLHQVFAWQNLAFLREKASIGGEGLILSGSSSASVSQIAANEADFLKHKWFANIVLNCQAFRYLYIFGRWLRK